MISFSDRNTDGHSIIDPEVKNTSGSNLLLFGVITRPHGVKGEVWVKIRNETDSLITKETRKVFLGTDQIMHDLDSFRAHRNGLLMKLVGCDDRNNADTLRGSKVYINVDQIEPLRPNEYFVHDLIGLKVLTEQGEYIGGLVEVLPTGANDVYCIVGGDDEILLPAIKSVIRSIDLVKKEMIVRLMPGMREG